MIDKVGLAVRTFSEIAKALQGLTESQFEALAAGRARIELHFDDEVIRKPIKKAPSGGSRTSTSAAKKSVSAEDAFAAIRGLTTSDQVLDYLQKNYRELTVAKLKDVARMLGPTVSIPSRPTKDGMMAAIVSGTAGFREDSAVMLPGGFR